MQKKSFYFCGSHRKRCVQLWQQTSQCSIARWDLPTFHVIFVRATLGSAAFRSVVRVVVVVTVVVVVDDVPLHTPHSRGHNFL